MRKNFWLRRKKLMAKNIMKAKPLFVKLSSHANNKTNSRQNPNLQTFKINGVKVRLTARQARTLKKSA
jgi:ribosomal protein L28